MNRLTAHGLHVGYGDHEVLSDIDLEVPDGELTAVIGPNGCGKSTLLHTLARLHAPRSGSVLLDGHSIRRYGPKQAAREIGLLPQAPSAPEGITVEDLVSRGRYPHQGVLRSWSPDDAAAVDEALTATGIIDLAARRVDELSGGQRQRVWIAMAVAQQTSLLLLDEPTTFLDMGHQVEVITLLLRLRDAGRTVVAVLHDVNQAARYATHVVAMQSGSILTEGPPHTVVTAELIEQLFGLRVRIVTDDVSGAPIVVPDDALVRPHG